jgi:hypothetical protein
MMVAPLSLALPSVALSVGLVQSRSGCLRPAGVDAVVAAGVDQISHELVGRGGVGAVRQLEGAGVNGCEVAFERVLLAGSAE